MSTVPRAESRRSYSWWWDSHISPKNSKWLQENLKDMDVKVKAMIKLIEEDADSFARRAEMYYKKRPELMKLVEEFYRAYRALAERYDHATGALRHAHRTMSEAFPNHIPLALPDESLSNSTPQIIAPRAALFDSDDLPKDAFDYPTVFNVSEENDVLATKRGLKHYNEMFIPRVKIPEGVVDVNEEEGTARVRLTEGKVRKSLFQEGQENTTPDAKIYIDSKNHLQEKHNERENAKYGIKHLQEQVSQLSSENQRLKDKIELESKHLDLSRADIQNLRDIMSKLESEKDAAVLQNQLSDETISSLEIEISKVKNEVRKLNEEMEITALKLSDAENQCFALEKANLSLQLELEEAKRELEELRLSLIKSSQEHAKTEMSIQSTEQLYNQSNEKLMLMTVEVQILVEKLKEIQHGKISLEEEVRELKDMNCTLDEHNSSCALKMRHLEDEIVSLKEINGKLEDEIEIHVESKKILQQEFDSLKDDRNEIDLKHQSLAKQMEAANLQIEFLEILVKELQAGHTELRECCGKLEDEKLLFLNKLNDMDLVSEKNSALEICLSEANVQLEELRKQIKDLEGMRKSLQAAVSTHVGEKAVLASQIEILIENVKKLSEKSTLLKKSLDDANTELEGLRLKLKELEELCQSLSHANMDLLAQKNDLISQLETIQQTVTNLEITLVALEEKNFNLTEEKDQSVNKILELENSLNILQKEHENQLCILQENEEIGKELEEAHQRCFSYMAEIFILQRCLYDTSDSLLIDRQKCMSLIQSKEIQLATLVSQIQILQEETKVRENRIEEEEQKSMSYMLEISILQQCLFEMKGETFTLVQECQKLLEASRDANDLIKQLEGRDLVRKETISLLMDRVSNVRDGISFLLKPLNINQELMNIDESEAVIIPTIMGEIKNLLDTVSNFHDDNQHLEVEILVYLSLLKQTGLEKVLLDQDNEKINRQMLVLKSELESLTRRLEDSMEELHNSREENNVLEEENSLIHTEARTMEHLYMFFRSLNDERMLQLKLLSGEMCSLLNVQNGLHEEIRGSRERLRLAENENKQLTASLLLLEELRTRTTILEFDVCTASSFCEELTLQVEAGENTLKGKSMELSNVNVMLQSKQEEVDEAKMMISELEEKITVLMEGSAGKDKQIAAIDEENRTLVVELNRFKDELEALKITERRLSYELQEEREEVGRCEGEMMELFSEVQDSVVNAAVLNEKVFELASRYNCLEIYAMVHGEMLKGEIALKSSNEAELKKKLDDFENENDRLRTNMQALSPLFVSLGNEISHVEEHLCQLAKLHGNQENPSQHLENHGAGIGDHDHSTMEGVIEMQNLIARVESLQKLVLGAKNQLDQEQLQSAANLESARREIEELKLKGSSSTEEKQGMESPNMVKDIELDQVSNSCGLSRIQSVEPNNDEELRLWETPDGDLESTRSTDHGIEAAEDVKNETPSSEIVADKNAGVYKRELSRELKQSQEEWNRTVIKRLGSHADKLSALQANARELKLKMEGSGTSARRNKLQFDTLRANLERAEKAIFELLDRNRKLPMMAELSSSSFHGEDMGFAERRKVLEQVRGGSDRIEMLELELQKIEYIFLKLEEECEDYTTKGGDRTPRVLLRDYLYGRRGENGKRRGRFCGCVRPRTHDDR